MLQHRGAGSDERSVGRLREPNAGVRSEGHGRVVSVWL